MPMLRALSRFAYIYTLVLSSIWGATPLAAWDAPSADSSKSAAPTAASSTFKQEELDQLLAPIALYPDALLSQIFMASTYPLEVVEAERWVKENSKLEGDSLTKALEAQSWDPSVKSLVTFPQVLVMMSEKLDWTSKLGNAVLAQQKDVLASVQKLRAKAHGEGNLKTTQEQKVIVEEKVIIIESTSPEVIYVPTYDPIVYGTWWHSAYPPYYYYPPGWVAGTTWSYGAGFACGAAWGYAWGSCGWHGGDIDVDINRNANFNGNIDRGRYASQYGAGSRTGGAAGSGKWQHDASHRKGVAYRDSKTAERYNRGSSAQDSKARENYRGRAEAGKTELARGGAEAGKGRGGAEAGKARGRAEAGKGRAESSRARDGGGSTKRSSAIEGTNRKGSSVKTQSNRGRSSMSGSRSGGGSRGGGSRGGGSRGGGGGRR